MDWKTFIVEIISSIAWPLVVGFSVWYLKDLISNLLPRLKKFKHKDTELEFMEVLKELEQDKKKPTISETKEFQEYRKMLNQLAILSSRSAIIEAYRIVEVSAIKAIQKAYPELEGQDVKKQVQISKMLREKVLDYDHYFQLRELLSLRNKAAHDEDFSLTGKPIETYINVALTIANELEQFKA